MDIIGFRYGNILDLISSSDSAPWHFNQASEPQKKEKAIVCDTFWRIVQFSSCLQALSNKLNLALAQALHSKPQY